MVRADLLLTWKYPAVSRGGRMWQAFGVSYAECDMYLLWSIDR